MSACDEIQDIIDSIPTGDPCDPNATGETCIQYLEGIVQSVENFIFSAVGDPIDDLCDPEDTGQACTEYLQPDPCDVSADAPYVGDLLFPPRNDVVIGNASARCPWLPGPIILTICLEYGPVSGKTVEHPPCSTWPSAINRVDGYDWQPCKPGFWRTYAFVMVGGFVLDDDHSGVVEIVPEDCLRFAGET